jgi:hypothetical protein
MVGFVGQWEGRLKTAENLQGATFAQKKNTNSEQFGTSKENPGSHCSLQRF